MEGIGLEVRAGLHTGECEILDGKVAGIAVSIGARVAAQAEAGEILVSQTVKDLVAGSGISFGDRGAAELKGVPASGAYSRSRASSSARISLAAPATRARFAGSFSQLLAPDGWGSGIAVAPSCS